MTSHTTFTFLLAFVVVIVGRWWERQENFQKFGSFCSPMQFCTFLHEYSMKILCTVSSSSPSLMVRNSPLSNLAEKKFTHLMVWKKKESYVNGYLLVSLLKVLRENKSILMVEEEDEVAWMIFGIEFQFLGQNVNRIDDLSRFNQLLPAGSWTRSNGAC